MFAMCSSYKPISTVMLSNSNGLLFLSGSFLFNFSMCLSEATLDASLKLPTTFPS